MNKIKISDSDKRLLIIFFAIVILACSYFFIFNKGMTKASELEAQNEQDSAKVQQMQQMEASLPQVKENIENMKQTQADIIAKYPSDMTTEKTIESLQDYEDHSSDFHITDITFAMRMPLVGAADTTAAGSSTDETVLEESNSSRQPRAATPVGFLSVIGAAVHPLDAKPKEMQAADSKKNDLHTAYVLLAGSLLLSLLLILGSSVRQLIAHSEHRKLTDQLEALAYVQQTYDESSRVQQEEQVYVAIDDATKTKNEYLLPLIEQLEAELPSAIKVTSMQTDDNLITLNMTADRKITVGQMLLNFQNVTLLTDPSIPSMSEQTDEESGSSEWTYTVNAYYADVQESEEQADE